MLAAGRLGRGGAVGCWNCAVGVMPLPSGDMPWTSGKGFIPAVSSSGCCLRLRGSVMGASEDEPSSEDSAAEVGVLRASRRSVEHAAIFRPERVEAAETVGAQSAPLR